MPQDLIWPPSIDRETPAGTILKTLTATKPPSAEFNRLVIFGSGALQLTVVPGLLSADIDISLDIIPLRTPRLSRAKAEEKLRRTVAQINAGLPPSVPYIQLCHWMTFQPANRWERRAYEESQGSWQIVYPHPFDILFSKLRRLEVKDVEAFERVIGATGHPTQAEFLNICQENYRDFELRATEDAAPTHLPRVITERDMRSNTIRLWRVVWSRGIKIDEEITKPVLENLGQAWHDYDPSLKTELSKLGKRPSDAKKRTDPRTDPKTEDKR
jgi:hypothetical protein